MESGAMPRARVSSSAARALFLRRSAVIIWSVRAAKKYPRRPRSCCTAWSGRDAIYAGGFADGRRLARRIG